MLGSIFIGLSGMNAFSNGLRQISNNITNINTTGFKSSDLTFSNLFGDSGGIRHGYGHGVSLSDARLDFAQGELRQTERDLDLAIDGGGFLVLLKDADKIFARTGSFEVNDQGIIVLSGTDYRLAVVDESGVPTSVSVNAWRSNPPKATTTVKLADNLSSTATTYTLSNLSVFNNEGATDTWRARFERTTGAPAGEWTIIVTNGASAEVGRKTLKFINGIIDPAYAKLSFSDDAAGRSVVFDFSTNVTSFSSGDVSTLRAADVDGYGVGDITSLRVSDTGLLEIAYSNEQTKSLGSVAIADFADAQALEVRDRGLFSLVRETKVDFLTTAHESVGRVVSRRLEASNVELSREFGDLILVQRGFQASSQVVSVSNDMIQQLFGIRGQG